MWTQLSAKIYSAGMTVKLIGALVVLFLGACAPSLSVRQQDLDAWVGQPVAALDTQPFFLTLPMVKTVTDSGIEIRNYVNGANIATCIDTGNAMSYNYMVDYVNYTEMTNCMSQFSACNNIFYIKDGKILEYAPTPSGNMRCYTTEQVLPNTKHLR